MDDRIAMGVLCTAPGGILRLVHLSLIGMLASLIIGLNKLIPTSFRGVFQVSDMMILLIPEAVPTGPYVVSEASACS